MCDPSRLAQCGAYAVSLWQPRHGKPPAPSLVCTTREQQAEDARWWQNATAKGKAHREAKEEAALKAEHAAQEKVRQHTQERKTKALGMCVACGDAPRLKPYDYCGGARCLEMHPQ